MRKNLVQPIGNDKGGNNDDDRHENAFGILFQSQHGSFPLINVKHSTMCLDYIKGKARNMQLKLSFLN